jgi:hypothetical protein
MSAVWVDVDGATPTDTVGWRLEPNGADWTLAIHVLTDNTMRGRATQHETRRGYWYLDGVLADTVGRALCFKQRPRDGATCYPFRLDTLPPTADGAPTRRRLFISGYRGQEQTRLRALVERP